VLLVPGAYAEPGVDIRSAAEALGVELRSMATWLGLEAGIEVGDRGELATPLRRSLT
jgi:uncharacterized protein YcaQ